MNWIKVSDRLPMEGKVIVAYWSDEKTTIFEWSGKSELEVYIGCGETVKVTHWFYMPDPPEEK
jgi:hypothetical protein